MTNINSPTINSKARSILRATLSTVAALALSGALVQSCIVYLEWNDFQPQYRQFFAWCAPTLAIASLCLALVRFAWRREEEGPLFHYRVTADSTRTSVEPPSAALPEQLRHRAVVMRRSANTYVVLLFVVVGSTLAIYTLAERIAGIYADPTVSYLQRDLREALDELRPTDAPNRPAENDESVQERNAKEKRKSLELKVNEAIEQLEAIKSSQMKLSELDYIAVLATRAGAAIILVFLAHFLINGYRYATRMAAAYDAKADALAMVGSGQLEQLTRMMEIMSVSDIGFDKVRTPTEQGLAIAKQLLRSQRRP